MRDRDSGYNEQAEQCEQTIAGSSYGLEVLLQPIDSFFVELRHSAS
ncbi:MAG: hypothetical protein M3R65_07960 [Gemmatimonadota bacterium]|nr:hypothetical protein [Gemmatimonadota bacterium]